MRTMRFLLVPLAVGLALAACGSDSTKSSTSATTARAQTSTSSAAGAVTVKISKTNLGDVLADSQGLTGLRVEDLAHEGGVSSQPDVDELTPGEAAVAHRDRALVAAFGIDDPQRVLVDGVAVELHATDEHQHAWTHERAVLELLVL